MLNFSVHGCFIIIIILVYIEISLRTNTIKCHLHSLCTGRQQKDTTAQTISLGHTSKTHTPGNTTHQNSQHVHWMPDLFWRM